MEWETCIEEQRFGLGFLHACTHVAGLSVPSQIDAVVEYVL